MQFIKANVRRKSVIKNKIIIHANSKIYIVISLLNMGNRNEIQLVYSDTRAMR